MNTAIKQTQTELKGVSTLLKLDPKNVTLITQKQKLLTSAVIDTKDKLDALRETQRKIDNGSIDATEEQYRDLEREIASTEAKLKSLSAEQKQFASVSAVQLQAVGKEFQQIGQKMTDAGKSLLPLTAAIGTVGVASVKASIEFESSFAGVKKTVNATTEELDKLAESARAASLVKPVDVNDINHIMELGGQLGIATDYLDKFAGVIADLDVATDMNIEDASMQLAQFMNICGTSTEDIDRLGATIVGLGNNSATTESAIMQMAMRIAGSGSQIGMSESQILGFSAALSSVGIAAEAGGTAISQIMSQIDIAAAEGGDDLKAWADVAGMTAEEFKQAWEEDAASAIVKVVGGMQEAVESGGNINLVLNDLGITAIRQTDTLKRLTSASELMASTMNVANDAWAENTALTNEATQRYQTTESRLLMLKNQVNDIGISIGNGLKSALVAVLSALQPVLDGVQAASRAFEEANPAVQTLIISAVGLAAAIGPILIVTGKITSGLGTLMVALGKSAASFAAKSAAAAGDTAATIANSAANEKNTISTNAQIIKSAIKEATDVRLAAKTAAKTAATVVDTAAMGANTTATTANSVAASGAAIKTLALSVAAKLKSVAATAATVAQLAWNAAMEANPIGAVVLAVTALVGVIGVLAAAVTSASGKQEQLTVASVRQKEKINELQSAYDEAVASQGEHSDAAVEAKYALDQETAAFEASKETFAAFVSRCDEAISSHDEFIESMADTTREADAQAGKVLYLATQIETLAGTEGKSAEEKAELTAMTEQLNASCEDLSLAYDEQTDTLNMSIEAIKAAAEAEADRIRAQAAMDSYSDLLSEQVELEMQLAEAQENLDAETQKNVDSWGKLGDVQVYTSKTQSDLEETVKDTQLALEENEAAQRQALETSATYATKQSVLARAMQEVEAGTMSAEEAAATYSDAVEGGITADEIRAQMAHEAAMKEQELAQATSEAAAAIESYAAAHPSFQSAMQMSGLSIEELSTLLANQDVTFEEAAKEIENYSSRAANGFSKVSDSSKNTLDTLYETLSYNLEATQNWSANLEAVFGRTGVSFSEEFVSAIKNGGVEEYGTVMAQLATLSDAELQAISDAYARNGQAGVEAYLAEQRLLVPGTKEALDGTGEAIDSALASGEQAAGASGTDTGIAYTESLKAAISQSPQEVQVYIAQLEEKLKAAEASASTAGNQTGSNYRDSLKNAISSCPAEVQTYIAELESKLQSFQAQAGTYGTNTGVSYGANTAQGMISQTVPVTGASMQLRTTAEGQLAGLPLYGLNVGTSAGANFAGGIAGQSGYASSAAFGLRSSAEGQLSQTNGYLFGAGAGNAFASGIGGTYGTVNANAASIRGCCNQWSTLPSHTWGFDAGSGFASGLRSAINTVSRAATSVANAIRAILHFTVPDEGPLADADTYGPDFMDLLATGMMSNIGRVRNAASTVATAAKEELEGAFSEQIPWTVDFGQTRAVPTHQILQTGSKQNGQWGSTPHSGTTQTVFYGDIILRADDVKDIQTFNDFAKRLQHEVRQL